MSRPTGTEQETTATVDDTTTTTLTTTTASEAMQQLKEDAIAMNDRAKAMLGFTDEEINGILRSIQRILPSPTTTTSNDDSCNRGGEEFVLDETALRQFLHDTAHLSHKDWTLTGQNSLRLSEILSLSSLAASENNNNNSSFEQPNHVRHMFERILREGNWNGAVAAATRRSTPATTTAKTKPWAVLVTGVNGIRKTTSIYQPWFASLLQEALVVPPTTSSSGSDKQNEELFDVDDLPCGSNSFFRQLDHMIATLCNEEFTKLYTLTSKVLEIDEQSTTTATIVPSPDVIKMYSDYKAAIFTRYRTLSELLGVALLREAQNLQLNCLLETSGRDVAMFYYVDHYFSSSSSAQQQQYNKLALHFQINDLEYAKVSVDRRMIQEIQSGIDAAVRQQPQNVLSIINANVGGPYGSEVLDSIQADSDRVWQTNVMGSSSGDNDNTSNSVSVGHDWYKATIQINAHPTEPWTAQAVKPDGTLGTEFVFEQKTTQQ